MEHFILRNLIEQRLWDVPQVFRHRCRKTPFIVQAGSQHKVKKLTLKAKYTNSREGEHSRELFQYYLQ